MDIVKLSEHIATCGQVFPHDLEEIKSLGFRSIVCARPDGEVEDQPGFAEIDKAARNLGLRAHHIPVSAKGATDCDHAAFSNALAELPAPVLGYCRSGHRATMLWRFHQNNAS